MLKIKCPYCGLRNETEFSYYGESDILRPEKPEELSEEEWSKYVFFRKNTVGNHSELWYHAHGCRRFFKATRNTITNQFIEDNDE